MLIRKPLRLELLQLVQGQAFQACGKSQIADNLVFGLENFGIALGTVGQGRLKEKTRIIVFAMAYGPDQGSTKFSQGQVREIVRKKIDLGWEMQFSSVGSGTAI